MFSQTLSLVQLVALSLSHSIFLSICLSKFSLISSLQQSRSFTLSVLLTYCRSICLIFAGFLSHTLSSSVLSVCLSYLLPICLSNVYEYLIYLKALARFVSLSIPQSNSHSSSLSDSLFLSLCPSFSPVIGLPLLFTHTHSRLVFRAQSLTLWSVFRPNLSVKLSPIFSPTLSFFHLVCLSHSQ